MTLIHGILSLTGDIEDNQSIKTMTESMQQYAPDGTAYWQQGNIALGANLLKTLPSNRHESNPVLTDSEAQLIIVADARIDNRDELCQLLSFDNSTAESLSDVRLILESYKKWGEQCAPKLIGDFAFSIWDNRNKSLFCCRDVFALRPFYYYHTDDWFIFSSDLDSLLALDFVHTTIDERFIADKIGRLHLFDNKTPYIEIDCLEAAHSLTLEKQQISFSHYWQPNFTRELKYDNEEQYIERYLELFTEAVDCRLASDFPIASLTSGGLDSASISAVANSLLQEQGKTLFCYSHVLPEKESNPEEDEKELVQVIAKKANLAVTWISRDCFNEEHKEYCKKQKVNLFLGASLKSAKQQGCRVLLGGRGGDQTATYHARNIAKWQLRDGHFLNFYQHAKVIAKERKKPLLRIIAGLLWHFHPFQSQAVSEKNIHKHLFDTCAYNPNFAQRINLMELARSAHRFNRGVPANHREEMWNTLTNDIRPPNHLAKSLALVQMDARYPMLDRRLVEYCLAVPLKQHRKGLLGRQLIRQAMEDILPDEIRLVQNKCFRPNPGIDKSFADNLAQQQARLAKAYDNPQIGQYFDLDKIQKRLDNIPELVAQDKLSTFRLGATGRVLGLIDFLDDHYN